MAAVLTAVVPTADVWAPDVGEGLTVAVYGGGLAVCVVGNCAADSRISRAWSNTTAVEILRAKMLGSMPDAESADGLSRLDGNGMSVCVAAN